MKEATGEGSMTIVTIVIIVALGAAAAIIVGFLITKAGGEANNAVGTDVEQYNSDSLNTGDLFKKSSSGNNSGNGQG